MGLRKPIAHLVYSWTKKKIKNQAEDGISGLEEK